MSNNNIKNMSDYTKVSPKQIHTKSQYDTRKPYNSGGGGSDMTEYATKQELKNTETKINGKIDTLESNLNGKIDTLESNLNGKFNVIDEKFNTQNSKFDNLSSTIKWFGSILSAITVAILVKFLLG